jgi:hypothetical protein
MAFSREIIKKILQNVRFRVPKNERDSYYTTINNTLVRVSNHCTRLYVWDNFLEENPKCKGMPIVSIVFEDEEDTFIEEECLVLKRNRKKPVKVKEYVYRLQGNPHFIEKNDEKLIIQSIKNISGQYIDKTGKSESFLRVSRNPGTNENKQYNKNTNMNKKLIRLTESDLRRIVKESVNKVLNEDSGIDAQERIYHTIANLENDLKTVISNTDSSSNQAFGSPDEKLSMISNGLSHIDMNLSKQAETTFSKLLEVMSELQNLRINLKTLGAKDSYWGHNFQRETPHGTVGLSNYH